MPIVSQLIDNDTYDKACKELKIFSSSPNNSGCFSTLAKNSLLLCDKIFPQLFIFTKNS